jgi:hypothetical protein
MKHFEFNTLYIIESLKEGETKTGQNLYTEMCALKAAHGELAVLDLRYIPIYSEKEWDECMESIMTECEQQKVLPIIHLEIHGDKEGLEFTNYECKNVDEISEQFRQINRITGCNLFVTLGVCQGLYVLFGIRMDELMPYCGAIGSFDELDDTDIEIRYTEFYKTLFTTFDIYQAYKNLMTAESDEEPKYRYIPIDEIFYKNYQDYLNKGCNQEAIKTRADETFYEQPSFTKNRQNRRKFGRDFAKVEKQKRLKYYKDAVNKFFDLANFPQNKDRFDIPNDFKELKERYSKLIV